MSETSTLRRQLTDNPAPMYDHIKQLLSDVEQYCNAGVVSGSYWADCLHAAQLVVDDYRIIGEETISPETLIAKIIKNKSKVCRKLKKLEPTHRLPYLPDIGLT